MDEEGCGIPHSQEAWRTARTHRFYGYNEEDDNENVDKRNGSTSLQSQDQEMQAPQNPKQKEARRLGKIFNDPIHNTIRCAPEFLDFIDTQPFQRLRDLHQLGLTHYVYYGATHKRFDHSIGVCVEAFNMADRIWASQRRRRGCPREESVDISQRDILVVGLAGLCHDLGHGPFSHVFDREFLRAKNITNWEHEDMSCMLMDYIVDTYHIDSFQPEEVKFAQSLIRGDRSEAPMEKGFLFDIVANQRNGLDVDKADYLARDAHYCGVTISHNWGRLANFAKVIENEICFKSSEYSQIKDLFYTREKMHRGVYTHRKVKSIEFMMVDALKLADESLGISKNINDPEFFIGLDDTLMKQIENYGRREKAAHRKEQSKLEGSFDSAGMDGLDQSLLEAQKIVERLRGRRLYRYVNEIPIPPQYQKIFEVPSPVDLCSYWSPDGVTKLNPEDVIVYKNSINFGLKDKNPLDHIGFYSHPDDTEITRLRPEQMGCMNSQSFQDDHLRVYSRVDDDNVCAALETALQKFARERFGTQVSIATPLKGRGGAANRREGLQRQLRGVERPSRLGDLANGRTPIVREYAPGSSFLGSTSFLPLGGDTFGHQRLPVGGSFPSPLGSGAAGYGGGSGVDGYGGRRRRNFSVEGSEKGEEDEEQEQEEERMSGQREGGDVGEGQDEEGEREGEERGQNQGEGEEDDLLGDLPLTQDPGDGKTKRRRRSLQEYMDSASTPLIPSGTQE